MKITMLQKIEKSDAHRKSRDSVAYFALKSEENFKNLVSVAFDISHSEHIKAFWALELACEKKLKNLLPYLDEFCVVLPTLTKDSAIRPATKIGMFLAKSNQRKNGISLSKDQEHQIIENMMDRLIQDEKVAAKVYAMKALFVFGKKHPWIYTTLKPIIQQDAYSHSFAYQASARDILRKI